MQYPAPLEGGQRIEEAFASKIKEKSSLRQDKVAEKFTMLAEQGGERGYRHAKTLTLEEFLKLPETKPASEYIGGQIIKAHAGKAGKLQKSLLRLTGWSRSGRLALQN